jgi:hypothetical protein
MGVKNGKIMVNSRGFQNSMLGGRNTFLKIRLFLFRGVREGLMGETEQSANVSQFG